MEQGLKDNYGIITIKMSSQKPPVFKEKSGKDWIYYGENNLYPQYLIDLYKKSSKHSAIINGKVDYIIGEGISASKYGQTLTQIARLEKWMKTPNERENINSLFRKLILDFEIFGGFALEVISSKGGGIAEFNHIDFSKLRLDKGLDKVWYSKDWSKHRQDDDTGLKDIPMFDENKKQTRSIIYYKGYYPAQDIYPLPAYIGAIPYIETDFEIANFHYNNIKNGFWGGSILNFSNGKPEPEEQEKIQQKIEDKFTGSDNANKFLLVFSDGKDRGIEVSNLMPNDFDKLFLQLNEQVRTEIFCGHRVTSPVLFGVATPGSLGQRNEMLDAYELFKSTYVSPKQREVKEFINYLLSLDNIQGDIEIKETQLFSVGTDKYAQVISNITKISPLIANKIIETFTVNEMREMVGLDKGREVVFEKEENTEAKILQMFSECGEDVSKFESFDKRPFEFNNEDEVVKIRLAELRLSDFDKAVINQLMTDGMTPVENIAKTLKTSTETVKKSIDRLSKRGVIETQISDLGYKVRVPIEEAVKQIDEDIKGFELKTLYSYEKAPGVSGADILPTTRDFCRELIQGVGKNKLYSREEIENISAATGTDVWRYRGGWWTHKGGEVRTPHCRHIWQQNIVRVK